MGITADISRDEIANIKVEVKEVKKDNQDLEKQLEVSKNEQKNLCAQVEKVDTKLDKVVSLLIDISKKQ